VLSKVNNCQKNSTVEIIPKITRSIIYKAKKWNITVGKLEIASKKQKILPSCGRKALLENGRPCHFLKVKFHFETCPPNTLVNFWQVFWEQLEIL
jgi:hypothetical protein